MAVVAMASPPAPQERRRATLVELGFALGRVEEILGEFRNDVGEWQRGISATLHDHGTRLQALEEDKRIRQAAGEAARVAREEARREVLDNEDRWGKWSPRAIVVTVLTGGGGLGLVLALHAFGVV